MLCIFIVCSDGGDAEMTSDEDALRVLAKSNAAQQVSLVKENVPDEMDAEQTFPTDEDIAAAQAGEFFVIYLSADALD